MIYKLAFASSDGKQINEHFGHAKRFYIYTLDSESEDYEYLECREVPPPCKGGYHEADAFGAVLDILPDVSAIVAQRAGPGARKFITERGAALYQIALDVEDALCLLLEDRSWEVDKWRSHTKN